MTLPCDSQPFSGTYQADDVQFLLRRLHLEPVTLAEKERLIQSGEKHYSDMISREAEPCATQQTLFQNALASGTHRLADEVAALAQGLIHALGQQPIILVSLVRAGVPLGVLLHRRLHDLGQVCHHYGISIVRDRGIDAVALAHIEQRHGTAGIVFVDGWTGKGAIADELTRSLAHRTGYSAQPRLLVLADLCHKSWMCASRDDWLIPFGILGAPVSGMISRSVWSDTDLHGCLFWEHLQAFDCSQFLVDTVMAALPQPDCANIRPCDVQTKKYHAPSHRVIEQLAQDYAVSSINRIKPGIAEATRAVLRRLPERIIVQDRTDPALALLMHLAATQGIPVSEVGHTLAPYRAVTLIKSVSP